MSFFKFFLEPFDVISVMVNAVTVREHAGNFSICSVHFYSVNMSWPLEKSL